MQGHTVSEAESERIINDYTPLPRQPRVSTCWIGVHGLVRWGAGWTNVLSRWFWVWEGRGFGSLALRSSTMVDGLSFYLDRATFRRDSIHSVCADHRTIG